MCQTLPPRPMTSVYKDGGEEAVWFTRLTDSQRIACGTFSLKTKAKADVFPSSDFELFCKGDFSSTNDLGEAKESYFLVANYSSAPLRRAGSPFPPTHLRSC